MIKIVVLSDTHIPERAADLPKKVYEDLKSADFVLHAGDITSVNFYKKLQKAVTCLKAVSGNMDEIDLKKMLPLRESIKVDKFKIGLIHGWGGPFDIQDLVHKEFLQEKPNIIVFGHSHQPLNMNKNGILFFNPGSPTDKIFSQINSYGIITINDKIEARIVNI